MFKQGLSSEQVRPQDRIANDEPLGELDAGERAELRVAALDQLLKERRRQPRVRRRVPLTVNWLTWHCSARRF